MSQHSSRPDVEPATPSSPWETRRSDVDPPDHRIVILGAGPSVQGDIPSALVPTGDGRRTLDWILAAFQHLPNARVDFVTGFGAENLVRCYPEISFHHNPDWSRTGPARSLALAPLDARVATFVCYSDLVFRADTVSRLLEVGGEITLAIDTQWRQRYEGRSERELQVAEKVRLGDDRVLTIGKDLPLEEASAEFAGLIRLAPTTARRLVNVLASSRFQPRDGLPEVLRFLIGHELPVRAVDVRGNWAELNAPQDLARFVLGTKAESLERLRPLVRSGVIDELLLFSVQDWRSRPETVIDSIQRTFPEASIVVRSSASSEDGFEESAAGAHLSLLDVDSRDRGALADAISRVFDSYRSPADDDQVLVQEMLTGVAISGVVMTRTHAQNAPYYTFNYDDTTSRTDTVTSGEGRELKTLFLHRGAALGEADGHLSGVLAAVREIESLVGHDSLDIEFAQTADGRVHVLQVRPIAVQHVGHPSDQVIANGIRQAQAHFRQLQSPSPFVLGRRTSLSVMSDWNPAEIIGTKAGPLAFSLYRWIITDETWARQRAEYGYRDVRPQPLLVDLLGHPFVDVRATFNSFVPATVEPGLAERLVEHYLDRLAARPELHDKVEFEILITCWAFDFQQQATALAEAGFDGAEIDALEAALAALTRRGLKRCAEDHEALAESLARHRAIRAARLPRVERAYLYLENARARGALTFSHLARAGFVAASLLRSLVARGVVPEQEAESFLGSMRTVSSALREDAGRVRRGEWAWEDFVEEYGHLRPGTYDITSPRYDSAPEEFLRPLVEQVTADADAAPHAWAPETRSAIQATLADSPLGIDVSELESFLRLAIEGREYGKFVFTRDLSAAIEEFAQFGDAHFVPRSDLALVPLTALLDLRSASFTAVSDVLQRHVEHGREFVRRQQAVCMPDQVYRAEDLVGFSQRKASANFVTRKKLRARLLELDVTTSPNDVDLEGKIVLIPSADPGFDWIFSRGIAGLLTMYGGANSHMAIRMAEFQLPGATGVGEPLYEALRLSSILEVDCASRTIRVVR